MGCMGETWFSLLAGQLAVPDEEGAGERVYREHPVELLLDCCGQSGEEMEWGLAVEAPD